MLSFRTIRAFEEATGLDFEDVEEQSSEAGKHGVTRYWGYIQDGAYWREITYDHEYDWGVSDIEFDDTRWYRKEEVVRRELVFTLVKGKST